MLAYNGSQISEGTNSVGIVRLDLGFCLCAVSGSGFSAFRSSKFNNNKNEINNIVEIL